MGSLGNVIGHRTLSITETTDVCDANAPLISTGELRVLHPMFQPYGRRQSFHGRVTTVKSFEDNAVVVKAILKKNSVIPDDRNVLVIDAGGSRRRSMVGSVLAQAAHDMGWVGIVVNGCIRDIDEINTIDIGIRALGPIPQRSSKKGGGEKHVPVQFAGALIRDGDWLCADNSGILVSSHELSLLGPIHRPIYHDQARMSTHIMADYTSPVEPHRLFMAHCLDDHHFLPKYLPNTFKSIQFVRGDSTSVGCIKLIHFAKGNQFKSVKNRVDELDVDEMYMKYTTIEGDILNDNWDRIVYEIKIKPSETGSHFKMIGRYYHHANKDNIAPTEEDVRVGIEDLKNMSKAVQEFLLLYPHIYA